MHLAFFSALLFFAIGVFAAPIIESNKSSLTERDAVDYYDPRNGGGFALDQSAGAGEPLNVIISGKSSPQVLTPNGFLDYARAVGFTKECFGLHSGAKQTANLGDGNGWVQEMEVLRESFGIPVLGTCLESLFGGDHLRVFRQNGPTANSGALFLAVSQELDVTEKHTIAPDGYDIGRDDFVSQAVGENFYLFKKYETTVQDIFGLLPAGSMGINHGIAQDGVVKLLTVTVSDIF